MQEFFLDFCTKIQKEIEEAAEVQRKNLTPESLIDRYGVKTPGFVEYDEFYEIYKNHVHFANEETAMRPMPKD